MSLAVLLPNTTTSHAITYTNSDNNKGNIIVIIIIIMMMMIKTWSSEKVPINSEVPFVQAYFIKF